jgi:uncharacterized membrane protein
VIPHARALLRLEHRVGRLLVVGVTLSAAALAVGLGLFLTNPEWPIGTRVIDAGLIILMATPILRVVISVVEYVRMREWFFASITLAVLAVLSVTVFYALHLR